MVSMLVVMVRGKLAFYVPNSLKLQYVCVLFLELFYTNYTEQWNEVKGSEKQKNTYLK